MMNFYALLFTIFAVAAYFIVTDESVAAAFYYVSRLAKSYIDRQMWWLMHNPANPVVKYIIYRRSLKMADDLMAEINKNKET